jgi:hypothetical protein
MWAAAWHKLQYKREQSVPAPVRRAINRVSALLETVDLEFDRVLSERHDYVESSNLLEGDGELDVDSLSALLHEKFPTDSSFGNESYDRLLVELDELGVKTRRQFSELIDKHFVSAMGHDRKQSKSMLKDATDELRVARRKAGRYFSLTGLGRQIIRHEFGDEKVNSAINRSK